MRLDVSGDQVIAEYDDDLLYRVQARSLLMPYNVGHWLASLELDDTLDGLHHTLKRLIISAWSKTSSALRSAVAVVTLGVVFVDGVVNADVDVVFRTVAEVAALTDTAAVVD